MTVPPVTVTVTRPAVPVRFKPELHGGRRRQRWNGILFESRTDSAVPSADARIS